MAKSYEVTLQIPNETLDYYVKVAKKSDVPLAQVLQVTLTQMAMAYEASKGGDHNGDSDERASAEGPDPALDDDRVG